jgi:hypothetical protein
MAALEMKESEKREEERKKQKEKQKEEREKQKEELEKQEEEWKKQKEEREKREMERKEEQKKREEQKISISNRLIKKKNEIVSSGDGSIVIKWGIDAVDPKDFDYYLLHRIDIYSWEHLCAYFVDDICDNPDEAVEVDVISPSEVPVEWVKSPDELLMELARHMLGLSF